MSELEILKEKLRKKKLAVNFLIQEGHYDDSLKEHMSEVITEISCEIHRMETGRSPDTRITVKFPDNNVVIEYPKSKEVFVNTIKEFSVEDVYTKFPYSFLQNADNLTDTVMVAPNRYLIVGLSNRAKKEKLKSISCELRRPVYIFFELA